MSAGVVYNNGAALTATAAGNSGEVLTSNGSLSAPTFQAPASTSISITGNSGGALTGTSFTFTGGTTGLSFAGSGTTETVGGTLVVSNGGTGVTSNTAYSVLCGGTTTTGAIQSVASVGTSGQVLTSNGASALPTFQTYVPTASGFVAYASANLSSVTGDGTFYLVQFNSTTRNNGTMFATGTGLATVPNSGLWFFNATVDIRLIVSANVECALLFEVNGSAQNGNVIVNPFTTVGSGGRLALTSSCFINLSATNTVGVRLQVSGNASKNIRLAGSGTSLLTSFSGSFIGT